jgi:hypothetical protein
MDVTITGANGIQAKVDETSDAIRASIRPWEHDIGATRGGHFRVSSQTGLMAAGIASLAQVFQVRWADTSKIFLLKNLTIQCSTCTGFAVTTVGCPLELIVGHGSTANGNGGTTLTPTGGKMRADMATSSFASSGEIRIASTAALTSATGQALDTTPIASSMGADNRTLVSTAQIVLFNLQDFGDFPLVLQTGDTLVVRTNSPAATGTWTMSVSMSWLEVVNF